MASEEHIDSLKKVRRNLYGAIKNKQQGGFKDCCEEYKFIRRSNTISFNNKMNRLGLTHLVLDEKFNQTDVFLEDIVNPIRLGSNITIGIEGYTGTGKSELAETIVLISKQANRKHKNREAELFLCWKVGNIYFTLMEIEKGSIVWVDESPKTIGKGSRKEKWSVENALHVIRKMENTFIFVDPKEIKVDICDLYLESAGMNFKTKTNRFMIMDDGRYYFGHIYVKLHNDKAFRDWYEVEKDKFIKETLEKGGKIKATEEELKETETIDFNNKLEEDIKTLRSLNVTEKNIEVFSLLSRNYTPERITEIFSYRGKKTMTTARISQIKKIIKEALETNLI